MKLYKDKYEIKAHIMPDGRYNWGRENPELNYDEEYCITLSPEYATTIKSNQEFQEYLEPVVNHNCPDFIKYIDFEKMKKEIYEHNSKTNAKFELRCEVERIKNYLYEKGCLNTICSYSKYKGEDRYMNASHLITKQEYSKILNEINQFRPKIEIVNDVLTKHKFDKLDYNPISAIEREINDEKKTSGSLFLCGTFEKYKYYSDKNVVHKFSIYYNVPQNEYSIKFIKKDDLHPEKNVEKIMFSSSSLSEFKEKIYNEIANSQENCENFLKENLPDDDEILERFNFEKNNNFDDDSIEVDDAE